MIVFRLCKRVRFNDTGGHWCVTQHIWREGDGAAAHGACACTRATCGTSFWQQAELGAVTGEEDITEAAESMLGSKGSHESRAIKVSDYQVIWDWEGIETAVFWRWCASLKIWGDDSLMAEKCAWRGANSNQGSDWVGFWHCRCFWSKCA